VGSHTLGMNDSGQCTKRTDGGLQRKFQSGGREISKAGDESNQVFDPAAGVQREMERRKGRGNHHEYGLGDAALAELDIGIRQAHKRRY